MLGFAMHFSSCRFNAVIKMFFVNYTLYPQNLFPSVCLMLFYFKLLIGSKPSYSIGISTGFVPQMPTVTQPLTAIVCQFLPREAMLSAVFAVVVCLSVCLCVCVCHTPVLYQNG